MLRVENHIIKSTGLIAGREASYDGIKSTNIYSSYLISSGIPNKSHINQYDGREYTSLEG